MLLAAKVLRRSREAVSQGADSCSSALTWCNPGGFASDLRGSARESREYTSKLLPPGSAWAPRVSCRCASALQLCILARSIGVDECSLGRSAQSHRPAAVVSNLAWEKRPDAKVLRVCTCGSVWRWRPWKRHQRQASREAGADAEPSAGEEQADRFSTLTQVGGSGWAKGVPTGARQGRRHNTGESRPRSLTEYLFTSLVTHNFPRQLHSRPTTSLLVFGNTCTRVGMNPGLISSEPRTRCEHLFVDCCCSLHMCTSLMSSALVTDAPTLALAQVVEEMQSVGLYHRMSILRLVIALD